MTPPSVADPNPNGHDSGEPPPHLVPPIELHHDPFGRLVVVDAHGECLVDAVPARAFPLSEPDGWIVLLDAQGRERLLIPSLASLPNSQRKLLLDELARREFVPVVQHIEKITGHSPSSTWYVHTDRGFVRFRVEGDDQVRRLGPNRLLITDTAGVRYLLPDTRSLPASMRRKLDTLA